MKILLSTVLLLSFSLNYCSEDQLSQSVVVEQLYAELWLTLEQDSSLLIAADLARDIELQLAPLRQQWRIPLNQVLSKKRRAHLDEAEAAFADVRPALLADKAELAAIQLDRAVQEVAEADPAAFQMLYLGQSYEFLTNWTETRKIVNDQMLCLMEWQEYVWWANLVRNSWQALEVCDPSPELYPWSPEKMANFKAARHQLGVELERFQRDIVRGDQCSSQDYAADVDAALYEFISHFGLPQQQTVLAN